MATPSFTQLVADKQTEGSIRNWVNDNTVPATAVLSDAEQWIYERLRCREMIVAATGSITINTDTISLPTRFRAPIRLEITGTKKGVIELRTPDVVEAAFSYDANGDRTTGKPSVYYLGASTAQFDVKALETYSYRFVHYAALAALSGSNETNVLTDRYGRLLRATCCAFAAEHQKDDEEKTYWLRIAEDALGQIESLAEHELMGDMAMVVG